MKKLIYRFAVGIMAGTIMATSVPTGMVLAASNASYINVLNDENTFTFGNGSSEVKLAVGTYTVPVKLLKTNGTDVSMANSCIEQSAELVINQDGSATMNLGLKSMNGIYAKDWMIYQDYDKKTQTKSADIVSQTADGSPTKISFDIPDVTKNGVYLKMTIPVMGGMTQEAILSIDWASLGENNNVKTATVSVNQFGKYKVTANVTVKDGKIDALEVVGSDFNGDYSEKNKEYLAQAIQGLTNKIVGLSISDAKALNGVDTVSGATYSSKAIKEAVMNALGVEIEKEVIPQAPTKTPESGVYTISIKNITDTVEHSLLESEKETAYLTVDNDGKMSLSYDLSDANGIQVLAYNGYYKENDKAKLTMDGASYKKDGNLISNVTVPLDGLRQTYKNNVTLFVDSMKNLNGQISGITFENGKFSIDSTVTLYWDSLKKVGEVSNKLEDGIYAVTATMLKTDKKSTSMCNDALNKNIKLTVKDGVYYATFYLNGVNFMGSQGYLQDLRYYDNAGNAKDVNVLAVQKYSDGTVLKDSYGTNYPKQVSMPLTEDAIKEGMAKLQLTVPVMNAIAPGMGIQQVYLSLDLANARKTTEADAVFKDTTKAPENPNKKEEKVKKNSSISLKAKTANYTGKTITIGKATVKGSTGKVTYTYYSDASCKKKLSSAPKNVGTYYVKASVAADTNYNKATSKAVKLTIKAIAPTIKTKTTKKTVKVATVKKKAQSFKIGATVNSKGKITYSKTSGSKNLTVTKAGSVTIKKGTKKGTYTAKVKILAAKKGNYKAATKTVTIKVTVKK